MKTQSLLISSFFFLCCSLVVNGDVVTDVCNRVAKNPNVGYDFCVKALGSDPKSHGATLQELGLISIKLINGKATSLKSSIDQLLKGATDPKAKQALQDCSEAFNGAVQDINDARTAFGNRDYQTSNIRLSAALDAASDCQDGFQGGLAFPLAQASKEYSGFVGIGLAITNMV